MNTQVSSTKRKRVNDVAATFDPHNWNFNEKPPPTAERGVVTLVGPYLCKSMIGLDSEECEDIDCEVKARAIYDIAETLRCKGYACPKEMDIPTDFDPVACTPNCKEDHMERLRSLPKGVAHLMQSHIDLEEIVITDKDDVKCGYICHNGSPPNHTWVEIRCEANSNLADDIHPMLQGGEKFALAKFTHTRINITNKDCLITGFKEDKELHIFAETGGTHLETLFTVQKRGVVIAKALLTYSNGEINCGGPNIAMIEVAKEWRNRGIGAWLLGSVEAFCANKFVDVLGEFSDLLTISASEGIAHNDSSEHMPDWFENRGYSGQGSERQKCLFQKATGFALKSTVTNVAHRPKSPVPTTVEGYQAARARAITRNYETFKDQFQTASASKQDVTDAVIKFYGSGTDNVSYTSENMHHWRSATTREQNGSVVFFHDITSEHRGFCEFQRVEAVPDEEFPEEKDQVVAVLRTKSGEEIRSGFGSHGIFEDITVVPENVTQGLTNEAPPGKEFSGVSKSGSTKWTPSPKGKVWLSHPFLRNGDAYFSYFEYFLLKREIKYCAFTQRGLEREKQTWENTASIEYWCPIKKKFMCEGERMTQEHWFHNGDGTALQRRYYTQYEMLDKYDGEIGAANGDDKVNPPVITEIGKLSGFIDDQLRQIMDGESAICD